MKKFRYKGVNYCEPEDGSVILPGDVFIDRATGVVTAYCYGSFGLDRNSVAGYREARPIPEEDQLGVSDVTMTVPELTAKCSEFLSTGLCGLDIEDPVDRGIATAILVKFIVGLVEQND